MPGKMARSDPRPSFGLPELLVAIHTSRQSCSKVGKAQIFALVWESSGESRLRLQCMPATPSGHGGLVPFLDQPLAIRASPRRLLGAAGGPLDGLPPNLSERAAVHAGQFPHTFGSAIASAMAR